MTSIPDTVGAADLADLLGLSANRVSVLAAEGVLPKAGRGKYRLRDCVAAYISYSRENPTGRPPSSTAQTDEKKRLTAAQAELAELKLAQARDELIPLEDVRREWVRIATDLRARLLAVSPRVASALAMDRPAAARLDAELRTALEDIADDR